MAKIKKGDLVVVISGRDKGKTGRVLEVLTQTQRVVVEGVQRVTKHVKAGQTARGTRTGGIETVEARSTCPT
jgi:large subunit ribosomal protein L24